MVENTVTGGAIKYTHLHLLAIKQHTYPWSLNKT